LKYKVVVFGTKQSTAYIINKFKNDIDLVVTINNTNSYNISGKGDVANFNATAATSLAVGRGITMYTQSSEPLGALVELPVNAFDTGLYFTSDVDIHGTMSSSVSLGTGAFSFFVKYMKVT